MQIFHKNKYGRSKDQNKNKLYFILSAMITELFSWQNESRVGSVQVFCKHPLKLNSPKT